MNQKELNEIRRRIKPERSSINHIYGCYVNSQREVISYIDESVGLLSREEVEKYLSLVKKTLSGTLGRNLVDISFATKQVMDSDEHRLLSALRKTELQDAVLRDEFFRCIRESVDMGEDNYLILLAFDAYDVPHYGKDGNADEGRGEVFKYILCCICPVKEGKVQLGYDAEEKRFHNSLINQIVAAPELGFMFPSFDDRSTNIYNALFYSRNIGQIHQDFIDAVFKTKVPMSALEQRETFTAVLAETDEKPLSYDIVQSVHEQLSDRIAVHKESKDPEPLTLSVDELDEILENSGLDDKKRESFCRSMEKEFGEDAMLSPANIIDSKKLEICTPEVKVTVDPKFGYLVQTRVIEGRKYIMISADAGVEVNGIAVNIEE
ncbi:MAG: DUF4317 domain-containing protein [Oscillospiraceae bacterium]|nr:DUF4317 domain-containing protein [Oscillospiraceae bacterium]